MRTVCNFFRFRSGLPCLLLISHFYFDKNKIRVAPLKNYTFSFPEQFLYSNNSAANVFLGAETYIFIFVLCYQSMFRVLLKKANLLKHY